MKKQIVSPVFDPVGKTVTFTGYASILLENVISIENKTTGAFLYLPGIGGMKGSLSGANVFALNSLINTAGMNVGDKLAVWYNDPDATDPDTLSLKGLDEVNDRVRAVTEGYKATYSAIMFNLAVAVSATDIFTISGSSTKKIKITKITLSGVATAQQIANIFLLKRSTLDTGGTSGAASKIPHDSADGAATALVNYYTANPTLGTNLGAIFARNVLLPAASSPTAAPTVASFDFSSRNEKAITLNNANELIAVNLQGVTITGGSLDIEVTWTEE